MNTQNTTQNPLPKKLAIAQVETKEQLIARLIEKASLDFKCCGHTAPKGAKN